MTPTLDTSGIVLAGYWNRMIFTPEWVGNNLFHQENIETEIALLPIFPVIYRHHLVTLEASSLRLVFRPRRNTAEALALAEEMATKVLVELPNTPLIGVGINFSFVERSPPVSLLELFNFKDAHQIAQEGWDIPERKLTRKLTGDHGTMNLTLGYNGGDVSIDVNFHTDTQGASEAVNTAAQIAVTGRTAQLKDAALSFLDNIYGLQLERARNDG